MSQKIVEGLAKPKQEEEEEKEHKKPANVESAPSHFNHSKESNLSLNNVQNIVHNLKDKALEPILTKKKEVERKVKTWKDQLKFLLLLPLDLVSQVCCKRRLPSQFFEVGNSKKDD